MSRRRWIADEIISENRAALVGEHAAHLARVLRAKVGQEFDIATGSEVRRGVVTSVSPATSAPSATQDARVEFELFETLVAADDLRLVLAIAIFKFDRMEWAIEKATELGVARIQPIIARRTDAHLATAAAKRVERWRRIAGEAAEQSRRVAPPEVSEPIRVKEFVKSATGLRVLLDETEADMSLSAALRDAGDAETILAIGPEGGWAEDEIALFQETSWLSATLGPTILRAETAAIAALAVAASVMRNTTARSK